MVRLGELLKKLMSICKKLKELLKNLMNVCKKLIQKKGTEERFVKEIENIDSDMGEKIFKDIYISKTYSEKSKKFFSDLENTKVLLSSERYIIKKWAEKAFKRFDIPGYPYFAVIFLFSNIDCNNEEKVSMIYRYLEYIAEYIVEQDALKLFHIKNTCNQLDDYKKAEDKFEKILKKKEHEYAKRKKSSIFLQNILCTIIGCVIGFSVCFYCMNISDRQTQRNSISISETQEYIFKNKKEYNALQNTSTISDIIISESCTVTFSGSATGGSGNYMYAVYYKNKEQKQWIVKQGLNENSIVSVELEQATDYDICIKVKDGDGTIAKKYFTLTVR